MGGMEAANQMKTAWEEFSASLWQWASSFAGNLLAAAFIMFCGWWLARLAGKLTKKAMAKGPMDPLAASFVGSVVKAIVLLVTGISAVARLQVDITSLVAALGAAGLTASFALQGSLSNFVSGMQIIFTRPFKMGDYLSFEGYEGTVKRIEVLYTVLATFDNKEVVVPNSKMTGSVVVNFTSNGTRRLDLAYGVSYQSDLPEVKSILEKLSQEDSRVLQDPAPVIAVGEWKDSSVTVVMKLWCRQEEYWNLYYAMQEAVKAAFDQAGVQIPFPQLGVHMAQDIEGDKI